MKKTHRKTAVTVIILNIVTGYVFAQISGTKSVGTGGDYETLSEAVSDVMGNGISGHTFLELKDGYDRNENFTIGHYPGNDLYDLTIRPEAGASQVTIRTDFWATIILDSARHVFIDGRPAGSEEQNAITLICEFVANGSAVEIWKQSQHIVIRNCNILFNCTRGIDLMDTDSITVTECDLSTYSSGPSYNQSTYGICGLRCANTILSNNVIRHLHVNHESFNIAGIYLNDMPADDSYEKIFNNFICLNADRSDSTSEIRGIYIWSSAPAQNPIDILFNTIYIGGTNASEEKSCGIYDYDVERLLNIQNNIVINARTNSTGSAMHYAVFEEKENGLWASDYNLLMVTGGDGMIGGYRGTDCQTLADWQNTTGFDSHSISKQVDFTDLENGDLHLTESSLDDPDLKCLPIAGITTDIDGDLRDDTAPYKGADEFIAQSVSGPGTAQPLHFSLGQAYPNPFNPETTIQFEVKKFCHVILKVYNILGKEMITLIDQYYEPGSYKSIFNASGYSSGIYFYRIEMDNFHAVKKMVFLE